MSAPATVHDAQAKALLLALGLTPEDCVVSLKLTLTAKDFATVEVERYVTADQLGQLVTEVTKYRLVPKEERV